MRIELPPRPAHRPFAVAGRHFRPAQSGPAFHPASTQNGSAVLIILVLLACMAAMLAANSTTLHALHHELKQVDIRQQKKFGPAPGP